MLAAAGVLSLPFVVRSTVTLSNHFCLWHAGRDAARRAIHLQQLRLVFACASHCSNSTGSMYAMRMSLNGIRLQWSWFNWFHPIRSSVVLRGWIQDFGRGFVGSTGRKSTVFPAGGLGDELFTETGDFFLEIVLCAPYNSAVRKNAKISVSDAFYRWRSYIIIGGGAQGGLLWTQQILLDPPLLWILYSTSPWVKISE